MKKAKWIIAIITLVMFCIITKCIFNNKIIELDKIISDIIINCVRTNILTNIMIIITNIGGVYILISFTIILLLIVKSKKNKIYICSNLLIITIINYILKHIIQRERPFNQRLIEENGYSFPSGHSMVSMAFYGFLIYLIYKNIKNKYIKWTLIVFFSLLIILIGFSRIYLGVHYTSDVLAGLLLSITYLILFITIINKISKKKIKNLIFDIDNTIIRYSEENAKSYEQALKKLNYDENDYLDIYNIIEKYEATFTENNNIYDKQKLLDFINEKLDKNYTLDLINQINIEIGNTWIKNIMLEIETIEYLSQKYNLYVFSNWFKETQEKRLEKIGYLKYFKKVFTADKYGSKPYKTPYINILKEIDAKPEQCIMIGDSKSTDILGANNVGIKAILIDFDGNRDKKEIKTNNYIKINDVNKLKNIL